MKLSACMIVKNEGENLARTLPALRKGADEVVVVDTGSSDKTVETAEKLGARIYHFVWIDDFSAARNESLKHASGDWILWMDADEFIAEGDIETLRKTLEASQGNAYYLPIYECRFGETQASSFYFRLKVFKNHQGFHFERAFNEQVYSSSGRLLETAAFLPEVKIAHWGRDLTPEKLKHKKERNFRILKEVMEKHPDDPFYRWLLANNFLDLGDKERALFEYAKVVELAPQGPLAASARIKKAKLLIEGSSYYDALLDLKEAVKLEPWNAETFNLIGAACMSMGEVDKAVPILENACKIKPPQDAVSGYDLIQYTYFPHFLLGNAYLLKGEKEKALKELCAAYSFQADPALKSRIEKLEKEVGVNG